MKSFILKSEYLGNTEATNSPISNDLGNKSHIHFMLLTFSGFSKSSETNAIS
jgi:hypothetical protein